MERGSIELNAGVVMTGNRAVGVEDFIDGNDPSRADVTDREFALQLGSAGGGIHIVDGLAELDGITLSSNAAKLGSGVFIKGGRLVATSVTFQDNDAESM